MKTSGSQLDQLPIATMNYTPLLPSGLDVRAVSTSDFGVSGTDSGVGRVIIAEGADDSLIGGGLREQISVTKGLTGTVMERLTDDDALNDATVVSAALGDAIVRFPQDGSTAKGRPPIEEVEWIADGVQFSVVIQLGPDATLTGPTFDGSISRFVDSFAPVGAIDSLLRSAPGERREAATWRPRGAQGSPGGSLLVNPPSATPSEAPIKMATERKSSLAAKKATGTKRVPPKRS